MHGSTNSGDAMHKDTRTMRRIRAGRRLSALSALCFGLAAMALVGAAIVGDSFGRFIGQIMMTLSCCALSLLYLRSLNKKLQGEC